MHCIELSLKRHFCPAWWLPTSTENEIKKRNKLDCFSFPLHTPSKSKNNTHHKAPWTNSQQGHIHVFGWEWYRSKVRLEPFARVHCQRAALEFKQIHTLEETQNLRCWTDKLSFDLMLYHWLCCHSGCPSSILYPYSRLLNPRWWASTCIPAREQLWVQRVTKAAQKSIW